MSQNVIGPGFSACFTVTHTGTDAASSVFGILGNPTASLKTVRLKAVSVFCGFSGTAAAAALQGWDLIKASSQTPSGDGTGINPCIHDPAIPSALTSSNIRAKSTAIAVTQTLAPGTLLKTAIPASVTGVTARTFVDFTRANPRGVIINPGEGISLSNSTAAIVNGFILMQVYWDEVPIT